MPTRDVATNLARKPCDRHSQRRVPSAILAIFICSDPSCPQALPTPVVPASGARNPCDRHLWRQLSFVSTKKKSPDIQRCLTRSLEPGAQTAGGDVGLVAGGTEIGVELVLGSLEYRLDDAVEDTFELQLLVAGVRGHGGLRALRRAGEVRSVGCDGWWPVAVSRSIGGGAGSRGLCPPRPSPRAPRSPLDRPRIRRRFCLPGHGRWRRLADRARSTATPGRSLPVAECLPGRPECRPVPRRHGALSTSRRRCASIGRGAGGSRPPCATRASG